jgi:hypothetical protein
MGICYIETIYYLFLNRNRTITYCNKIFYLCYRFGFLYRVFIGLGCYKETIYLLLAGQRARNH